MNVRINIESMILEGLSVTKSQAARIQTAVEFELARLLTVGGLSREMIAGGAFGQISVSAIAQRPDQAPPVLGHQIARAVYRGIGHKRREVRKGSATGPGARTQGPSGLAKV
jgi:hypothetical protein